MSIKYAERQTTDTDTDTLSREEKVAIIEARVEAENVVHGEDQFYHSDIPPDVALKMAHGNVENAFEMSRSVPVHGKAKVPYPYHPSLDDMSKYKILPNGVFINGVKLPHPTMPWDF